MSAGLRSPCTYNYVDNAISSNKKGGIYSISTIRACHGFYTTSKWYWIRDWWYEQSHYKEHAYVSGMKGVEGMFARSRAVLIPYDVSIFQA